MSTESKFSFLLLKNMPAFTHLLSFWRLGSGKYALALADIFSTWFLCNVPSGVSCKCLPVKGGRIKLPLSKKGVKKEQIELGKKEMSIFISPNFVNNSFIKPSWFPGIRWYYTITINNKFCLACRCSLCFRLFRTSYLQITEHYQKNTSR